MPEGPSESTTRREIAAEQEYVNTVYERLDASTRTAQSLVTEGMAMGHVGHEGGLVERDAMVYQASKRLSALNAAHEGLVFGRLDLVGGEKRYIGRIGVRDADREILLIDWRAPAASLFYRATAQDPVGVIRRRVIRCAGEEVLGVEDDLLDADAAPEDIVVVGEGALMASLTRARDGQMHSVVATIQKEQDEAIRAPARGATIIAGGPGTGKTVVALHRAAYLLYTDRRRFEAGGVLVVGPSSIFVHYIDRVLPSLGETNVTLRSIGEVVDGIRAAHHDLPTVAAVKGSARMIPVLRRLAADPLPGSPREFTFFYRDDLLKLESTDLDRIRTNLHNGGAGHNKLIKAAQNAIKDALWNRVRGERAAERGSEEFAATLEDSATFWDFFDAWWPAVDAVQVWSGLGARLAVLADDQFTAAQIAEVQRTWNAEVPSIEDVPLIDELRHLLGDPPEESANIDDPRQMMSFEVEDAERRKSMSSVEDDGFAHLLIDEAQDLSPMQWRMLGRRGRFASWTIVGDEAQSSWPDPLEAREARAHALGRQPEHRFRLSTNYRNAAEVYELAAKVARRTITNPDLATAVRRTGRQPEHLVCPAAELENTVAANIESALRQVDGTIAVVWPRSYEPEARAATWSGDLRVQHLDALATKGLEFDAVIVVEPDELVAESVTGWRSLYVVLTRATWMVTTIGSTDDWWRQVR